MSAAPSIPDLWPSNFGADDLQPSPSAILRQQGYRLGERTEDVVYGEVESDHDRASNQFRHSLFITAPFLKVRQRVIDIWHGLSLYPAEVALLKGNGEAEIKATVTKPDELVKALREMFSSPSVVQLIRALLYQARDLDEE